jgi:hypothetical protein
MAVPLLAFAITCCQHPSSTLSPSNASSAQPRLLHPEQLVTAPEGGEWPSVMSNGQYPRYPPEARSHRVQALVIAAFVVNEDGRPEPRTISILESPKDSPDFALSVCNFLRAGARFRWEPHASARAIVIAPFAFLLSGVTGSQRPSIEPDLHAVRDSVRQMSPAQLVAWLEPKPHCF